MKVADVEQRWCDQNWSYFDDEEMAQRGFTLDPFEPAPATAREALDLAWDLAHPIKEGQVIPAYERTIGMYEDGDFYLEMRSKDRPASVSEETFLRTLDPLPEPLPDWLTAPAITATCNGYDEEEPRLTVHVRMYDGDWRCVECSHTTRWRNLTDVTPLYPKETTK